MKGHREKTQTAVRVEDGKVQQKHTQVVDETGGRGGIYWDMSSLLFPYAISKLLFLMDICSRTVCASH
jgi:hypothetical protein